MFACAFALHSICLVDQSSIALVASLHYVQSIDSVIAVDNMSGGCTVHGNWIYGNGHSIQSMTFESAKQPLAILLC